VDTNSEFAPERLVGTVHLATLRYFWRFTLRCHSASNSSDHAAKSYPGHCVSVAICCLSSVWLLWSPRGQSFSFL